MNFLPSRKVTAAVLLGAGVICAWPAAAVDFPTEIQPILEKYCYECHGPAQEKAGLNYSLFETAEEFKADHEVMEETLFVLAEMEMPPETQEAQPSPEERNRVVAWLDALMLEVQNANPNDPGLVVMPRLNHREYARVIRDLTGREIDVRSFVVADTSAGEGFLNVGQAQTMTVGQFEGFFSAAKKVAEYLLATPEGGILWSAVPRQRAVYPEETAETARLIFRGWFDAAAKPIFRERFDRLKEATGLNLGAYLEALWQYRYRAELGRPEATFEEIAAGYEAPLFPTILARWWELLHWKETPHERMRQHAKSSFYIQRVAEAFASLPAPGSASREQVRQQVREAVTGIDAMREAIGWDWLRKHRYSDIEFSLPYENTAFKKMREELGKGFQPFHVDLTKPRDGRFFLIVGDAWDGNEGDFVVWQDGEVEFADGSTRPWQEVFPEVTDRAGKRVAWGSHPLGDPLPDSSIGVQAPSVLELQIPEGSPEPKALRMKVVMDPTHGLDSSTVPGVDDDLPRFHEHVLYERRVLGSGLACAFETSKRATAASRAAWHFNQASNIFFKGVSNQGPDAPPSAGKIYDEEAVEGIQGQIYFWADDALKDWIGHGADRGPRMQYHFAYYFLPLRDYLPFLDEEQQQEFEDLKVLVRGMQSEAAGQGESAVERQAAARQLGALVERAWRQPVTPEQLEGLLAFYDAAREKGESYTQGLRQALVPALVSPQFLYRFIPKKGTELAAVDGRPMAERLAFLLWGSLPDERLLKLGYAGQLADRAVLEQEVTRMLEDERGRGFAEEFAGFWLGFADFESNANPDPVRFEQFVPALKAAMNEEPIRFFQDLFANNLPLTEALYADYTFLNGPLAQHYGVPGIEGPEMRKVTVHNGQRGGILGMGSFLTKYSAPLRTSPVKRGAWLYESVLGIHLPPPPPNVGMISDDEKNEEGLSAREQLEEHRRNPNCFSCHDRIDPLGIALESYDPIGRWRTVLLDGSDVDDQGRFVSSGEVLDGVEGLRGFLRENEEAFLQQFCRKLVGYMLGRPVAVTDKPLIETMLTRLEENELRPRAAILAVIESPQFQTRRELFEDSLSETVASPPPPLATNDELPSPTP